MKDPVEVSFYLGDQVYLNADSLFEKLQEADFRDSYRDEPFRYHSKLLDLLLQTSLCNKEVRQ